MVWLLWFLSSAALDVAVLGVAEVAQACFRNIS